MNTNKITLFKEVAAEYGKVLNEGGFLKRCIYNAINKINSDIRNVYNINKNNVLLLGLKGSTILGNIIENTLFDEMSKNANFIYAHYNADAEHKDITCENAINIPNVLQEKMNKLRLLYNNHPSFDSANIFGLEVKTSKIFSSITANKTASTNKDVQKDPFSFYLMINYKLTYNNGLPQLENIQARICWIDNTSDIWGKSYKTGDAIQIKYSTAPDIFVGIIDDRLYTKGTKIHLDVHPYFR